MKDLICLAINKKQRIEFIYNSKKRIAEPQSCGLSPKDKDLLRAYLVEGGSRPEQLFEISKIERLKLLDEYFFIPGPNYRRNDSAMKTIYCQL